jgi:xanthine dehydrogenase YagS FAD-binding subunit
MQTFQMYQPRTLDEALGLLASHGSDARLYAGGQDLLYRYKRRLGSNPRYLVNVKRIPDLDGFTLNADGSLTIRPLTRLRDLEESAQVREQFPLLHAAASEIASPQIRSEGTVGGNLFQDVWCWYLLEDYDCWLNGGSYCYAVTGDHRGYHSVMGGRHCIAAHPSDLAPALVALQATCTIAGPSGSRTVPADALWAEFERVGTRLQTHMLQPDEIAVQIDVPAPAPGARGAFQKYRQRGAWDFALASVAASLRFEGQRVADARVVMGGVATHPVRAHEAERLLTGQPLTDETIEAAAQVVAQGARPLRLNRYKVSLAQGLCRKVLRQLR